MLFVQCKIQWGYEFRNIKSVFLKGPRFFKLIVTDTKTAFRHPYELIEEKINTTHHLYSVQQGSKY